jgi:copper chaperone CopZ
MNKLLVVSLMLIAFVVVAFGQSKPEAKSVAMATKTISIGVPTIQCGSCKMNIEKALNEVEGIKTAKVDLKKKTVAVEFVKAKLDLSKIETAITKAGYAANDKKADPEAYEKLDECCKVPQEQD